MRYLIFILIILNLNLYSKETYLECDKDLTKIYLYKDKNLIEISSDGKVDITISYKDKERESGRMVPPLFITETLRLRLSAHPEQKSRSLPASLPADSFSINRT